MTSTATRALTIMPLANAKSSQVQYKLQKCKLLWDARQLLVIANDLKAFLSQDILIDIFTYSKSIFDTVSKMISVSEKRLLISFSALLYGQHIYRKKSIIKIIYFQSMTLPIILPRKWIIYLWENLSKPRQPHPVNQQIFYKPNNAETDFQRSEME